MICVAIGDAVFYVIHAKLSNERGQEAVEAGPVAVITAIEVGAEHEDDLHEWDAADTSDVFQLRQVTDLKSELQVEYRNRVKSCK